MNQKAMTIIGQVSSHSETNFQLATRKFEVRAVDS
jgi:hypothetical protein